MSLHDELSRLADTAPRPDIDHTVWDRGRAMRRRDRLVTSAIVLVMVVVLGGLASLVIGPPRAVAPADDPVPEGAIPSRIYEPPAGLPAPQKTFDIGRASVAFESLNGHFPVPHATVIGAADGRYHFLSMPDLDMDRESVSLSPDGARLAWRTEDRVLHVADLTTGKVTELNPRVGTDRTSWDLGWHADSLHLTWAGQRRAGIINVVTGEERPGAATDPFFGGVVAPDGRMSFKGTPRWREAPVFRTSDGRVLRRPLPPEMYPKGAGVEPLGWVDEDLVLARVLGPEGSYVEGEHLVLFTSPDRPESEWTFRILMRDVPSSNELTLAVDLIPDLDGTSNQQLTHDFGEPDWPAERDISWLIGLGVAGALSVLYGLRWLWRRRTGLL